MFFFNLLYLMCSLIIKNALTDIYHRIIHNYCFKKHDIVNDILILPFTYFMWFDN